MVNALNVIPLKRPFTSYGLPLGEEGLDPLPGHFTLGFLPHAFTSMAP